MTGPRGPVCLTCMAAVDLGQRCTGPCSGRLMVLGRVLACCCPHRRGEADDLPTLVRVVPLPRREYKPVARRVDARLM